MAEIEATIDKRAGGLAVIKWPAVTQSDTMEEVDLSEFRDPFLEFHASGTFDGATFEPQGAMESGDTMVDIADANGNAVELTAAGGAFLGRAPLYFQPLRTGGTASSVDVYLLVRHA